MKKIKLEDVSGKKFTVSEALKHSYTKWRKLALQEWYDDFWSDFGFDGIYGRYCACCTVFANEDLYGNVKCSRCPIFEIVDGYTNYCCYAWYDARAKFDVDDYSGFIKAARLMANRIAEARNRMFPKLKSLPLVKLSELPLKCRRKK